MESARPVYSYASEDVASEPLVLEQHLAAAGSSAVVFCDLSDVLFKWRFWAQHLPRVQPFYAVKCNYDPRVLQTLAQLGAGFDCASQAEIEMVRRLPVDPSRIIYAQPVKYVPHLKYAEATGTDLVTFDRRSELEKVQRYTPGARCVLRIRYDAKDVLFKMGDKFGCCPQTEAPQLLRLARDLQLAVVGTSFHVGTGCNDIESYRMAIGECKRLTDYGRQLGLDMRLLDIGGGFHGTRDNNFGDIARVINAALEEFFPERHWQIIAEPGQFFTTSAFTLFAQVLSSRRVESAADGRWHMEYVINESIYVTFRSCPEILNFLRIEAVGDWSAAQMVPSVIRGLCTEDDDNRDLITEDVALPVLSAGDVIRFRNMGSYSLSMKSCYGKFAHPPVKYFVHSRDRHTLGLDEGVKATGDGGIV